MASATLERPETISIATVARTSPRTAPHVKVEPNFGPEDMHAIKAIAFIMTGIFLVALLMYTTITLFAWLGP